jgi:hypothetical protein
LQEAGRRRRVHEHWLNPLTADPAGKGESMVRNFEDAQKVGAETVEATVKSFGAFSKSAQAIAMEMADYSKKSFEQGAAATEKLMGAKSLEAVFEVQQSYLKSAYEGFVAQQTKLGELYAGFAQEACKPYTAAMVK